MKEEAMPCAIASSERTSMAKKVQDFYSVKIWNAGIMIIDFFSSSVTTNIKLT